MLTLPHGRIQVLLWMAASLLPSAAPDCLFGQPTEAPRPQMIGQVLGKAVYRQDLRTLRKTGYDLEGALHELFLEPLAGHYFETHRSAIEPTEAEIDAVEAFFRRSEALIVDPDNPSAETFRLQLKEIDRLLSSGKLSKFDRDYVESEKPRIEQQLKELLARDERSLATIEPLLQELVETVIVALSVRAIDECLANSELTKQQRAELEGWKKTIELTANHDRMFAIFMLGKWKFERHLYDHFGGGRILWQQPGLEAYDANRRWLEDEERKGNFKFADPELREEFYRYWKTSPSFLLIEDEAEIHLEFLEPEWAPRIAK
jgi:hypothetical protein